MNAARSRFIPIRGGRFAVPELVLDESLIAVDAVERYGVEAAVGPDTPMVLLAVVMSLRRRLRGGAIGVSRRGVFVSTLIGGRVFAAPSASVVLRVGVALGRGEGVERRGLRGIDDAIFQGAGGTEGLEWRSPGGGLLRVCAGAGYGRTGLGSRVLLSVECAG